MKMKFILTLGLLFSLESFSSNHQVTFAFWNKPDVNLYYSLPAEIDKTTKVLFIIHGGSRNAEEYLEAWKKYAIDKNIILVAPEFTKEDYKFYYILERASDTGKINKNTDDYLDQSIDIFFSFIKSKYDLSVDKYKIYGHSGGGMFVQRILLLNNSDRVSEAVIANPTWYTSITNNKFPYGIKNSNLSSEHIKRYFSKKVYLLIGEQDRGFSNTKIKGILNQGDNRFERAKNFMNNLISISDQFDIPLRWTFKVVQGVGHQNKKMVIEASKILLSDVN